MYSTNLKNFLKIDKTNKVMIDQTEILVATESLMDLEENVEIDKKLFSL